MENYIIYKGIFGSGLYGTSTPNSDTDYKQIHMSSLDNIILGKNVDNINMSTNLKERNTKDDIDYESKELREFIHAALGGQTFAFDMLFTPKKLWLESTKIWKDLIKNREMLLTRNVSPFLGYCRSQSMKYSKKGDKLKSLTLLLNKIKENADYLKMTVNLFFDKFSEFLELPHIKKYNKELGKGDEKYIELYFYLVQASFPGERSMAEVVPSIKLQLKNYGKRAEDAMINEGIDLKAYYHALRICWELEEYLLTKHITFPCPKRKELLKVRLGKYSKEYIESYINEEIERVLLIENTLPEANYEYWNNWMLEKYLGKYNNKLQKANYLLY